MTEGVMDSTNATVSNLATVWELVAATVPDADALIHATEVPLVRSWRAFESRAARLAAHLGARGVGADSKVAIYLYNGPEYLETTFAAFKARAVPVNVNYRYLEHELEYLYDNSDAEAVIFSAEFASRLDAVRDRLPKLTTYVCVGADDEHPLPEWADDYESVIASTEPAARIDRSGDDLWFLYTGGTTGMPKGVMWPHRSLLGTTAATFSVIKVPVPSTADEVTDAASTFHERGKAVRLLPAAPLMHGTSAITSLAVLSAGGCVVTLPSRSFDGDELCRSVQDHRVTQLTIVGDAFAKPMLAALEGAAQQGEPYDLSSLKVVVSSGVMWSQETKDELLDVVRRDPRRHPRFVRGRRFRQLGRSRRPTGPHRPVRPRGARAGVRRGRPRRRARFRRARPARRRRADPDRLLQGPRRRPPGRSARSPVGSGRCRATSRPSRRTARSCCSAGAPPASTPPARRSTPKRSRRR